MSARKKAPKRTERARIGTNQDRTGFDTGSESSPAPAPVDAEIRRAAERIGIPPEALARQRIEDAERQRIVEAIGPKLVLACDQLGEELAEYAPHGGGDYQNVLAALRTVWQVRWELGLFAKPLEDADEQEQSAGGAS